MERTNGSILTVQAL